MGAKVSSHRVGFGRLSDRSSDESNSFTVKNQSHNVRSLVQSQSYEEQSGVVQTLCDTTDTRKIGLKEKFSKSSKQDLNSSRNRSRRTQGALFSEEHSSDMDNDSDTSSSITIGNGTAETILKKLRRSRIQEQKTKSETALSDSKKILNNESNRGIDDIETKPIVTSNSTKRDSDEDIFSDNGDSFFIQMSKGSTFNSNLYNGQSLLPASPSKLGFTEQKSGDIIFTAYIGMKGPSRDEYQMIKKVSKHRIRGLEKQQNCKIQFFDEPLEMKAQPVYKLQITGPGYREVLTCKNSLPKCITERLITANNSTDELFLRYQRRK
ncbi:unnamed protein product [Hymenolepis diminuta]|uniref:Uncharacterized protein n=1 Tax=Hymenolepis diminuta TaxID=6216 RepID=A0A0R3SKS4_HYMDI|nr:unnamed protein product [Hymenolepis diminuta]